MSRGQRCLAIVMVAVIVAVTVGCSGGHHAASGSGTSATGGQAGGTSSTRAGQSTAGQSSAGQSTAGQSASGRAATQATGWTRSDLKPVTQPVLAAGTVVVYAAAAGGLALIALDPSSGHTLWQLGASPSHATRGVAPGLAVVGGLVVFFKDAGNGDAQLAGIDAKTGATVWSVAGTFGGWPYNCADDHTQVCVVGAPSAGQPIEALQYDGATGRPSGALTVSSDPGARDLGVDLYDAGTRSPETLVATSGSARSWSKPLSSVFSLGGASTDNGWNFDRVPAVGLFVGSVGGPPLSSSSTQTVADLSRTMTAGFHISDGTTTWNDPATLYVCEVLPCPGSAQSSSGNPFYAPPTLGLRLHMHGQATFGQSGVQALSADTTVRLEGFDLATGHTMWAFDTGANRALIRETPPPQIGAETVILPDPSGAPVEVDLTNGAQHPVPPGTVAWCSTPTTYKVGTAPASSPDDNTYDGVPLNTPCDAAARPVPTPRAVPSFVGPSVGGLVMWSGPSAVSAAPPA